jgi:hypothetical protein
MTESDEGRIGRIGLRIWEACLNFHFIDLRPGADGPDRWTLTVGSTDYLGRPGYTMPGPAEVGEFPARSATLTSERVRPILRRLAELVIPANTPYTGGLDGYAFALRFERGDSSVEYNWWEDVTDAWEPLEVIVDQLLCLAGEPDWPRLRRRGGPGR